MLPDPAPTTSSVLLVDDDEELVDMLKNYLEREGYSVGVAADGEAGVRAALSGRYAIAVVDIMMPRMNGIETLMAIRNVGSPVSKKILSEQGLGRSLERFDRSIDVHVSSIRQKLGQFVDGRSPIVTVHRLG